MTRQRVLIVGGGGVLGQALASEFAGAGCDVSSLRRGVSGTPTPTGVTEWPCDLGEPAAVRAAVTRVVNEQGPVDTLVFNAAQLTVALFTELSLADFEQAWRVSVGAAAASAQAVLPGMLGRGGGTLIFTGATASIRGAARFAAFASAKFALRALAQSLARELHPQGVHVAHVVLDGLLRGSPSVARFGGSDAAAIDPADAARAYRWLAGQPRSAWTRELELRPGSERF